jgi:cullin 3
MYTLFSRVPSTLDILREFLFEHVKRLGFSIVTDHEMTKDPLSFVQKLLDLKSKYDKIVVQALRTDKKVQKSI